MSQGPAVELLLARPEVKWLLIHLKACRLETIQDFLIKLDIKPLMHLLEISTFSLDNVIVRLFKIMNTADRN
mgnify:CR=1 FL=1